MVQKSSIKPQRTDKTKTFMAYNDKSYQSFIKNGFEPPSRLDWAERSFLSKVDPKKGSIEREVTKIIRVRAVDPSSKKHEKKEYIHYYENWYGKDWLGRKVNPVIGHLEGRYEEQVKEPVIDEKGELVEYEMGQSYIVYTIPFNKAAVDKIIENSARSDQESILYTIKVLPTMRTGFSYEQFVLPWDEVYRLAMQPGGPNAPKTLVTAAPKPGTG